MFLFEYKLYFYPRSYLNNNDNNNKTITIKINKICERNLNFAFKRVIITFDRAKEVITFFLMQKILTDHYINKIKNKTENKIDYYDQNKF